ncbi:aldehyde ferredoxin oxidoreductase family protein [Thermomicrobium sp. 4228-Ro]|uniref:aldehyde ferredoxin oxidoreductase family protein n=1 Tax=Thermomicrobium sp. 4228-Ro TaxID=2993937 RepID=UPI002248D8A4|nr:aldehyde ferredoxin oxidoreductase family protein [Thermomicrobium sp. 4228-Ro]MCX2727816.1 aldehyde ferredoxin oxidoreductase family protein [Thermomicrobium sp. 4228-Ro]
MQAVHGRALLVDLGTGDARAFPIPPEVSRSVLGGTGLATRLLLDFAPPRVDPWAPENPFVIATGPFIGTGLTTSSKLAIATTSPQTGFIGDSLTSSYFALVLRRTGFDGLVLIGQAPDWSVLVVEDDRVNLRPAHDLLGLDPEATAAALRAELGRDVRVAAIGRAGERLVRFAAVVNDGRLAGRTGPGAVLGAKRLKAVAVRGTGRFPPVADPAAVASAARRLAERSLGPETAKYRELGTVANLAFFSRLGVLPTRNFSAGSFPAAEALAGERLVTAHHADRQACAACTVGCEHHFRTTDAGPPATVRLEYETLFALGSLCGIDDPNVVLRAAALCDQYGMDAISAGGTIAWAMECVERGIALPGDPADWPRFGDGMSLLRTLEAIGERRGPLGDLLAEGSRRAAEIIGQGSESWAMHVKGLELPGYHPKKLRAMALGFAVTPRGACHNRTSAYEIDFSEQTSDQYERIALETARNEDRSAVLDALPLCKFLRHCFDDFFAEAAELVTLVTGMACNPDELRVIGERIVTLKKLFNLRQGWTRSDDTLPPRLLGPDGIDPAELDALVAAYYRVRGWTPDGLVPPTRLHELGLDSLVEHIAAGR